SDGSSPRWRNPTCARVGESGPGRMLAPMATKLTPERVRRYRTLWEDEVAGAALYRVLAESSDERRRPILLALAEAEEKHAQHWAALLTQAGEKQPSRPRLPLRVRVLSFMARRFGADTVLPLVLRLEASDA